MEKFLICVKNNEREILKYYMLYSPFTLEVIHIFSHQNIVYSIPSFLQNGSIVYLNRYLQNNSGLLIVKKNK